MARRISPVAAPARPEVLAFLDDIKRNPDDDTPRLILADWLEEQGDSDSVARSEFLRVQCALASLSEGDPRRKALQQRERQLLKLHKGNWGRPWRNGAEVWKYRRGLGQLREFSAERLLRAPWDRLVQTEALAWVDGLDANFTAYDEASATYRRFAVNSLLGHLVSLSLSLPARRGAVLLESLAACTSTPYLSAIEVRVTRPSSTVRTLTHSPLARQLRKLALTYGRHGPDEIAVLASSPCLTRLRRLDLSGSRLGPEGMRSLAASPSLVKLGELRLCYCYSSLGAEGVRALGAGGLPSLHTLNLSGNNLKVAGAEALAVVSRPTLRRLDLSGNGLTSRAMAALTASPLLDSLTHLHLFGNSLGDNGIKVLVASPWVAKLTHLNLLHTDITDQGARALATSPYLDKLTFLNVNCNNIGRAGKRVLRDRFGPQGVSLTGQRGR